MQGLPDQGCPGVSAVVQRLVREPNAVLGFIGAVLNLAVLFGWDLSAEQIAGVNVAFAALVILVRQVVTPWQDVVARRLPGEATEAGPAASVPTGTPVELVTGPTPDPPRG